MNPGCCPAMRFMRKYQTPMKMRMGSTHDRRSRKKVGSTSPLKVTLYWSSICESSGSTRTLLNSTSSPASSFILPCIWFSLMAISVTFPSLRRLRNWLYGMVFTTNMCAM